MANEDVGALVARVIADTEQFKTEMAKMGQRLDSATGRMNRSLSAVDRNLRGLRGGFGLVSKAAAAFGVGLSVTAIVNYTRQTLAATAELKSMADRLGTTTEALSELGYVARLAEVDTNTLTTGLQRMTRRIAEAAQGSGEARGALAELSLSAQFLRTLPLDQQFEHVADALSSVTNESDRVRLAMKLFDSEGVALTQTMKGGADEIRRLRNEARDLGISLSSDAAKKADEAKDAIVRLTSATSALWRELATELAPALTTVATKLREALFPNETETLRKALEEKIAAEKARIGTLVDLRKTYENELNRNGININAEYWQQRIDAVNAEIKLIEGSIQALQAAGTPPPAATVVASASPTRAGGGGAASTTDPLAVQVPSYELPLSLQLAQIDEKKLAEQNYTAFLEQQHQARVQAAAQAASEETQLVLASQQQQLEFRSAMAAAAAQLALGLFGQHKAIQLAAIAFEKLAAVRRVKLATDLAAWQAFQSQLIPGDPTSLARAQAAYAAVKARGVVAVAQTVALSVVSGLAEAANVVGSSGAPGSFTNPVFASRGLTATSAIAGGSSGRLQHKRNVVEVHLSGNFYGWDEYMRQQVIGGIREAVNNGDVILIRGDSANGELLRGR